MSQQTTVVQPDGDLISYDFNGNDIQLVPHDGDFWVTGEAVGGALGYLDPSRDIAKVYKRNQKELQNYSCVVKLPTQVGNGNGQKRRVRVYNEEAIMIITMLSRQPKAAEFRVWAVQILKAYRRGELAMTTPGERDRLLELCIRESGNGNIAAMDTLIKRYGYREGLKEEQQILLAVLRGKVQVQIPSLPGCFISGEKGGAT
jgi:prophage antirepressor-like protein